MERTITYQISESEHGLRVEQYLRHKGYSYQNLTQLKKMPESILINGIWSYMRSTLSCGDTLTVHIQESEYSEHIPPVQLPLDIIYEDDDLLVVNKPAGMPIHPSLNNYKNSLANALMYYYKEQGKPFILRCTEQQFCKILHPIQFIRAWNTASEIFAVRQHTCRFHLVFRTLLYRLDCIILLNCYKTHQICIPVMNGPFILSACEKQYF